MTSPVADKKLEVSNGTSHGTALLDALGMATVRAFLTSH